MHKINISPQAAGNLPLEIKVFPLFAIQWLIYVILEGTDFMRKWKNS